MAITTQLYVIKCSDNLGCLLVPTRRPSTCMEHHLKQVHCRRELTCIWKSMALLSVISPCQPIPLIHCVLLLSFSQYTTPNGSTSSSISPSSTSPASTNPASASHSPLKGSAIAGIVVASVAFVGAIIVSLFFFLRRRNGRGNLNLEYRPTIIDRDSIHSAHVSHFLPPPAASSESQSGESSAMAVIDTKYTASPASRAITLRTSQTTSVNGPPPHGTQPQNTSVTEFQLQDLTNRVPAPGTHVAQQTHATGRNTEDHDAPPQYDS